MNAYAAFRSPSYRLLLAGSFLSSFGLQMLSVAVSWDLYLQTKSALVLGNVGFVQVAPFLLFALFAGDFADRYNRKQIIILTQILLVIASGLLMMPVRSVSFVYLCLFFTATARAFQGPARLAVLPNIIPREALQNGITWNSSAQEIANVGGPAAAGLLLSVLGTTSVYGVQFGCALITLLCFGLLSVPPGEDRSLKPRTRKSLLEGVEFVWQNKLVFSALSLDLLAVLFGGATALLPIYAAEILHTGVRGLGLLRAAPSAGAVLMAVCLAHAVSIRRAGRALLGAVAGFGAATIVFGLSRSLWLSVAMLILIGALDNVSVVLRHSLVQTETPDRLRGRVLAVNNIFISCSNQLGAVESGWSAAWLGAMGSVVSGGLITLLVVAVFAMKSVSLRKWSN